jgi:hypothetical protein
MGNAPICKSTVCSQPRPIYKTALSNIFSVALEKSKAQNGSNLELNNQIHNHELKDPDQREMLRLKTHVKLHIKNLIDYFETNKTKLAECGFYLYQRIPSSFNPEIHALALMVCEELLNESRRFCVDSNFYNQMMQTNDPNSSMASEHNPISLTENLLQFEGYVVDILTFILDKNQGSIGIGYLEFTNFCR